MKLADAKHIADQLVQEMAPHCERIEIAGSIRRQKPEVKDIEIVCIPKPFQTGIFEDGFAKVVNQYKKVKGEPPCRYTQRELPSGINLDIFMCTPQNWGLIFIYRTGSKEFNIRWLQEAKDRGYSMREGQLFILGKREPSPVPEEIDLFRRIGMNFIQPEDRK